ncbi:Sec-independent protein translocase subunit TatA/TatB [Bythopirellula goksoeyrii]|nr:twin-arginine translocase TatA/TatE family subunit [Bythopirellula goksoeyrii]
MATATMFTPGIWQALIVAMIVLLLFGTRLPSVMRSLGEGITEFKKGMKGTESDPNSRIEDQSE